MQIIDNHIKESKAVSFLTDFPGEYYTFLKGKWKVYPKENRGRLRAGRRNERHERRGKLRMLLYERIKCWEMTKGKMLKTGMTVSFDFGQGDPIMTNKIKPCKPTN